jgi:hypothetical protein
MWIGCISESKNHSVMKKIYQNYIRILPEMYRNSTIILSESILYLKNIRNISVSYQNHIVIVSALFLILKYFCFFMCNSVDGSWGNWLNWGACSVTCGDGTRSRSRSCNNPSPSNGGEQCQGSNVNSQNCNIKECNTFGKFKTANFRKCIYLFEK